MMGWIAEEGDKGNLSRRRKAIRVEFVIDARYKQLFTSDYIGGRLKLVTVTEHVFGYHHLKRAAEVTTRIFATTPAR